MTLLRKAAHPLADGAGIARITALAPLLARFGKGRKPAEAIRANAAGHVARTRGARPEPTAKVAITARAGSRCYRHAPECIASYVPPRKFSGAVVRRDWFRKPLISLVRAGRLELPRPYGQQILSLPRLPFRHARSSCAQAQPSLGLILASAGPGQLACGAAYRSDPPGTSDPGGTAIAAARVTACAPDHKPRGLQRRPKRERSLSPAQSFCLTQPAHWPRRRRSGVRRGYR